MIDTPLLWTVASNWWMLALRGVLAILFAICAFIWPGLTLAVLVLLWGAFALVDGIVALIGGIQARWWAAAIFGLLGIAAGVLTLLWPGITAFALLMVIASWAIVRGAFEIAAAIRLRKEIAGEWILILSGIVAIVFGVYVVLFPALGALSVVWLIGLWSLAAGILMLSLAFRVRRFRPHGGRVTA